MKNKLQYTEQARHDNLLSYDILDSSSEAEFDQLTFLASQICQTPTSLITFTDSNRQWFKSKHGFDINEIPRKYAFCSDSLEEENGYLIIPDTREDARYMHSPLVTNSPNIIFYAGVNLVSEEGYPLGTICVIDYQDRLLSEQQLKALQILAEQTVQLLSLRKKNNALNDTVSRLKKINTQLEEFAHLSAHDIKSPLGNISSLIELLKMEYSNLLPASAIEIIDLIDTSSNQLRVLVDNLLEYAKLSSLKTKDKQSIEIKALFKYICQICVPFNDNCDIKLQQEYEYILTYHSILEKTLLNLVSNAIKYNSSDTIKINISFNQNEQYYVISVTDNGNGIDESERENLFKMFHTSDKASRTGERSSGVGLASIKQVLEDIDGNIELDPTYTSGSRFVCYIPKNKH